MPKVNKQYNYHKLCRQTHGFTKNPSAKYKREQARALADSIRNEVADYDEKYIICNEDGTETTVVEKAHDKTFGIFNKKGYRAIKLFYTREEAEEELKTWRKPEYYDIREIEWFEDLEDLD